jgi:hypothetical protein
MWLVCGWYAAGMRLVCGWYAADGRNTPDGKKQALGDLFLSVERGSSVKICAGEPRALITSSEH